MIMKIVKMAVKFHEVIYKISKLPHSRTVGTLRTVFKEVTKNMGIYSKEDGIVIYIHLISTSQRLRRNIISLSMKDLWKGKILARSSEVDVGSWQTLKGKGRLQTHKECREWIFSDMDNFPPLKPNYEKWEFDDYLGYFEAIWSLKKRRLIDEEIAYDLLRDYLISVYEANNFELKAIIEEMREEGKRDFYGEGVEKLYKEMKKCEQKKKIKLKTVDKNRSIERSELI